MLCTSFSIGFFHTCLLKGTMDCYHLKPFPRHKVGRKHNHFGSFFLLCLQWIRMNSLQVLRFSPLLHRLMLSANKIKLNKCDFNSIKLSCPFTKTWHTTCCLWKALDVFRVICTLLHHGHLSVRVGDSLWRS